MGAKAPKFRGVMTLNDLLLVLAVIGMIVGVAAKRLDAVVLWALVIFLQLQLMNII